MPQTANPGAFYFSHIHAFYIMLSFYAKTMCSPLPGPVLLSHVTNGKPWSFSFQSHTCILIILSYYSKMIFSYLRGPISIAQPCHKQQTLVLFISVTYMHLDYIIILYENNF